MKAKHRYDQEEYFKWLENGADEDLVEILVFNALVHYYVKVKLMSYDEAIQYVHRRKQGKRNNQGPPR